MQVLKKFLLIFTKITEIENFSFSMLGKKTLNIFISYSQNEEDRKVLKDIQQGLAPLQRKKEIAFWDDSMIPPGAIWDTEIKNKINDSDVVLLLLSPAFLASNYIYETELELIFSRQKQNLCIVVPILLHECLWKEDKRISEKSMLPKHLGKKILPIFLWANYQEAIGIISEELKRLISTLHQKNQSLRLQEITSKDEIEFDLDTIWHNIPIMKELSLKVTVNCDRKSEYLNALCMDFQENIYTDQNICYLICGCETQNPESIAKRLIYEFEEDFYIPRNTYENLVHNLDIAPRLKDTWNSFWKLFCKYIGKPLNDIEHLDQILSYQRLPIICYINEHSWGNTANLEAHIQHILLQFSKLPDHLHRFVFFFIFEFKDLHLHKKKKGKWHDLDQQLLDFDENNIIKPHLRKILIANTVDEMEVKLWLKSIIDKDKTGHKTIEDYINLVLTTLSKSLNSNELKQYGKAQSFNMDRVEIMQKLAYQFWNRCQ